MVSLVFLIATFEMIKAFLPKSGFGVPAFLKVPCRKEFEAQSTMGSKRQLKYPCSRSLCTVGQKYKL
jgi:hypothetical protein